MSLSVAGQMRVAHGRKSFAFLGFRACLTVITEYTKQFAADCAAFEGDLPVFVCLALGRRFRLIPAMFLLAEGPSMLYSIGSSRLRSLVQAFLVSQ